MKSTFRILALVLVVSVLCLSMVSCIGSFSLTKGLLDWNKSINKWLGSILLIIFLIIQVYTICALIDWIILNVIEFYSGSNPMSANEPTTKNAQIDGKNVSMTFMPGDGMNFDLVTEENGVTKTMQVRSTDEGVSAKMIEAGATTDMFARFNDEGGIDRTINGETESIDTMEMDDTLAQIPAIRNLGGSALCLAK